MSVKRFDQAAAQWDEKPSRVVMAEAVADTIRRSVPLHSEMQALEFGCGTGLVGFSLLENLGSLDGIDAAEGMIAAFNEKAAAAGLAHRAKGEVRDIFGAPLQKRYDLIFSSMVFHHLPNPAEGACVLAKLLKAGGYLAIADLDEEDGTFHPPEADGVHHFGFSSGEMEDFLRGADLEVIGVEEAHTVSKNGREYRIHLAVGRRKE